MPRIPARRRSKCDCSHVTRRAFLLAPAIALAQPARPQLALLWTTNAIPEAFARQAVVLPRTYTCCPDPVEAARAIEHGRFPHAITKQDASLWNYFDRAAPNEPEAITVITSASSDGMDSPHDRSIRVPLAIRWPNHLQPRVASEVLFSHADLLPTLLALTGQPKLAGAQGRDLSSWLTRGVGEKPDSVYSEGRLETRDEWRALIRGFDKIVWNLREEIIGLYNVADDPLELTDLQDKREHRVNRDSMLALARQWMLRLEDGIDSHGLRTRRPA